MLGSSLGDSEDTPVPKRYRCVWKTRVVGGAGSLPCVVFRGGLRVQAHQFVRQVVVSQRDQGILKWIGWTTVGDHCCKFWFMR